MLRNDATMVRACVRACARACARALCVARACACVRACVRAVRACVRARGACVRARVLCVCLLGDDAALGGGVGGVEGDVLDAQGALHVARRAARGGGDGVGWRGE